MVVWGFVELAEGVVFPFRHLCPGADLGRRVLNLLEGGRDCFAVGVVDRSL